MADDAAGQTRVLEAAGANSREDGNYGVVSGGGGLELTEKGVNFGIEEGDMGMDGDAGSEPVIPGLASSAPVRGSAEVVDNGEAPARRESNFVGGDEEEGGGDDWDSDSEDDLQIVLNDNDHGPMAMERAGMPGGEEDDEDEDGLVIVTEGDPNQPPEEQDWGEDAAHAADGERKETGEGGKTGSGTAVAPKIGYSSHGYHPFHSQFKVSCIGVCSPLL